MWLFHRETNDQSVDWGSLFLAKPHVHLYQSLPQKYGESIPNKVAILPGKLCLSYVLIGKIWKIVHHFDLGKKIFILSPRWRTFPHQQKLQQGALVAKHQNSSSKNEENSPTERVDVDKSHSRCRSNAQREADGNMERRRPSVVEARWALGKLWENPPSPFVDMAATVDAYCQEVWAKSKCKKWDCFLDV